MDTMFRVLAAALAAAVGSAGAAPLGSCGEGFDDVGALAGRGWLMRNVSLPLGSTGWFQGIPAVFPAQGGSADSYVAADYHNASGSFPVVSNWLVTPDLTFAPGNSLSFWTRELDDIGEAANRLEVRLCVDGAGEACTDLGPESGDTDGYVTDLLDVNPDETAHGYPSTWTQYTVTPAMGLAESGTGRVAFHYYTLAQGDGTWGTMIGIDTLSVVSAAPCALGDGDTIFADGFDG